MEDLQPTVPLFSCWPSAGRDIQGNAKLDPRMHCQGSQPSESGQAKRRVQGFQVPTRTHRLLLSSDPFYLTGLCQSKVDAGGALRSPGYEVIFFPKFHCELNYNEQCWGFAKRIYRMFPTSSKEEDLKTMRK
jgi:hypothetical protein